VININNGRQAVVGIVSDSTLTMAIGSICAKRTERWGSLWCESLVE